MCELNPRSAHRSRTISVMNRVHARASAIVVYRSTLRLDGEENRIVVRKPIRSPTHFLTL